LSRGFFPFGRNKWLGWLNIQGCQALYPPDLKKIVREKTPQDFKTCPVGQFQDSKLSIEGQISKFRQSFTLEK